MVKHSNWLDFLHDWGDAVGGVLLAHGYHIDSIATLISGLTMILGCIYLKHYHGK